MDKDEDGRQDETRTGRRKDQDGKKWKLTKERKKDRK